MDDLISRQDAIRWVKAECNPYGKPTLDYESGIKVIEHLERMSSVQSEKRTEERTETHACDLIDRQAALNALSYCQTYLFDSRDDDKKISLEGAEYAIEQLPSAQPVAKDINVPTNDCISRAEAISACINDDGGFGYGDDIIIRLEGLPSVQPNLDEWCNTCREYDHERHCCPRYNRVIREALKEVKKDDWVPCSERLPEEEEDEEEDDNDIS